MKYIFFLAFLLLPFTRDSVAQVSKQLTLQVEAVDYFQEADLDSNGSGIKSVSVRNLDNTNDLEVGFKSGSSADTVNTELVKPGEVLVFDNVNSSILYYKGDGDARIYIRYNGDGPHYYGVNGWDTTASFYNKFVTKIQLDDSAYAQKIDTNTFTKDNEFLGKTKTKNLHSTPVTISASAIDWSLGNNFTKILSANTTFTMSNMSDGQVLNVAVTNTASNYTVTWTDPASHSIKWSGSVAPTQTVGAKTDVYCFIKIGNVIYASVIQNF